MTLLGYFNSLRELGGARRLIEDEVRNRLAGYATRVRVGETEGLYENRKIDYEPVELTSRVSTAQVSEAKRRLSLPYSEKDHVDVAIATNMISVGLDIIRLGLMVVFGQPKTSAEYIQATSRVGRDHERPGPGRDHPQHPQAARSLALRAVRRLPRVVLPQRRGHQRHAILAPGPGSRPCRHSGFPGPTGPLADDATREEPRRSSRSVPSSNLRSNALPSEPATTPPCPPTRRNASAADPRPRSAICSTTGARWPTN